MNDTVLARFSDLYPLIKETIGTGHTFSFTAYGNSMAPTIQGGKDRVTLSPIEGDIALFDILFYRRDDGTFVLHRVIKLQSDGRYSMCGDNQYVIEKDIRREQVLARMTVLERDHKVLYLYGQKTKRHGFALRRFFIRIRRSLADRLGFSR